MDHFYLAAAIIFEVIGTMCIRYSEQLTKLWPTLILIVSYGLSFFFMSLAVRSIPIGIVYAIWAGAGIILIILAGWYVFGQKLDIPAIIGIALIIAGLLTIQLFSKVTAKDIS